MRAASEALEELFSLMTEEQVGRKGVYDDLSPKDVLAHIAAWQKLELSRLRSHAGKEGCMNADISGYAPVENGELYYEAKGEGPAMIFIHAGVADHTMWAAQAEEFSRDHNIITYDSRGFGQSRSQETTFSNRQDIVDLMAHLGIEKAVLVGCSRGGQIALDFAVEQPEKTSGLVWVCGGVSGLDSPMSAEETEWFGRLEELWAAQNWERLSDLETLTWTNGIGQPEDRTSPELRAQVRKWIYGNYTRKDGEATPRVLEPPAAGRLGSVKCPVLVVVGDLDTTSTRAAADLLAASIPQARKVVFSNAAHLPNLEQPAEFDETLHSFLEENSL